MSIKSTFSAAQAREAQAQGIANLTAEATKPVQARQGHTPGPWMQAGHLIIAERGAVVVASVPSGKLSEQERGANIDLIINAPDLLEACKKACSCASLDSSVMELLKQAIARAEGRA